MTNFLTKIIGDLLDVTGCDVAAFSEARLSGATTHMDRWRASLDRAVAARLAE